jgi:hypothetical protein
MKYFFLCWQDEERSNFFIYIRTQLLIFIHYKTKKKYYLPIFNDGQNEKTRKHLFHIGIWLCMTDFNAIRIHAHIISFYYISFYAN